MEFHAVEEKRVREQQMLQALVEFHQCKAVNMQQTLTIHYRCYSDGGVPPCNYQNRESKEKKEGQRMLSKARPNSARPT